jgi:hypothetical protein
MIDPIAIQAELQEDITYLTSKLTVQVDENTEVIHCFHSMFMVIPGF